MKDVIISLGGVNPLNPTKGRQVVGWGKPIAQ